MTAPAVTCRGDLARSCLLVMAVAAFAANLGCSQFRARRQRADKTPAALGADLPGRDIYAKNSPAATDPGEPLVAGRPTPPETERAGGLTTAPSPIADPAPPSDDAVVDLQPPVMVDPSRVGTRPTSSGVPNGARLIAASRPVDPPAAVASAAAAAAPTIAQLVSQARAALDAMTTYQLALRRQERVNGVLLPPEDLVMSIRRSPKAARLSWVEGPHRGREVLYRADEPGGLMHINMADAKLPLPRLSIAPDSPMVMKNSRHPITEAGLDPVVASLEQAEQSGTLVDLGMITPPSLDHPLRGVSRQTSTGDVWHAFFDPANHLPTLVECRDAAANLLEFYQFQHIQPNPPELAAADAFDPDARWGAPRGLFGRASARAAKADSAGTTR